MHDLTKGSITRHLLTMAGFIGMTMVMQTAYVLIDLYFVSRLGKEAVAGVGAAGSLMFLGMALSQVIGVGVLSLVSRAIGAGREQDADIVFNQGVGMALLLSVVSLAAGYAFGSLWVETLGADAATADQARIYLFTFLPSMALMFPSNALGSALRAAGVVRVPTIIQSLSLVLNIVLAPVLIAGWGTGVPLGVAGAGLASTIAVVLAFVAMVALFTRLQTKMRWRRDMAAPRAREWFRILEVGLPSAFEFFLLFVVGAIVYWAIRDFGAEAQAGYGIGGRVLQSVMLPAMAVAFSAAPIIGQNLGAGNAARVRETFYTAVTISGVVMVALALLMHISPSTLTAPFSPDEHVLGHANLYLQIISWNLVASGIAFTCSGAFQGLGNTRPSLISSSSRLVTFVLPVLWMEQQPWVTIEDYWWLSVASTGTQAVLAVWLVFREMRRKLGGLVPVAAPATSP